MEVKHLLDLLNTGFTIIENGLLCGDEHRKQEEKLQDRFSAFIDKMAMFI